MSVSLLTGALDLASLWLEDVFLLCVFTVFVFSTDCVPSLSLRVTDPFPPGCSSVCGTRALENNTVANFFLSSHRKTTTKQHGVKMMERTSQTKEPHCLHCHLRRTSSAAAGHFLPADELAPLRNLSESRTTSGTSPVGAIGPSRARSVVCSWCNPHTTLWLQNARCRYGQSSSTGPFRFLQSVVRQKNVCFLRHRGLRRLLHGLSQ